MGDASAKPDGEIFRCSDEPGRCDAGLPRRNEKRPPRVYVGLRFCRLPISWPKRVPPHPFAQPIRATGCRIRPWDSQRHGILRMMSAQSNAIEPAGKTSALPKKADSTVSTCRDCAFHHFDTSSSPSSLFGSALGEKPRLPTSKNLEASSSDLKIEPSASRSLTRPRTKALVWPSAEFTRTLTEPSSSSIVKVPGRYTPGKNRPPSARTSPEFVSRRGI